MKSLLIIIFIILHCSIAWCANKIDTTNFIKYRILGQDASYMYGLRTGRLAAQLHRLSETTDDPAYLYAFPSPYNTVSKVWSTSTPGLIFAQVSNSTTSKFYIFKSVDYGAYQYASDALTVTSEGAKGGYFNSTNPYIWKLPDSPSGYSINASGNQSRQFGLTMTGLNKARVKVRLTDGANNVLEKTIPIGISGAASSGLGF